jgi:hypothetical protein
MKGAASISAMVLLLGVTACNRLGTERSYTVVENTAATVRTAFNADAGKVRVLIVVSPTCGECLEGASEVSEQVAKINQGKTVPLYVLWVPRRGGREKDVPAATRVIADTSAQEFWDGNDLLGMQYKQVLGGVATRGMSTCSTAQRLSGTAICPRPRTSSCTRPQKKVRDWMPANSEKE